MAERCQRNSRIMEYKADSSTNYYWNTFINSENLQRT